MTDLLDRLPENFEMITMQLRAKPLLAGDAGPFVVVALQVCTPLLFLFFRSPVFDRSRRVYPRSSRTIFVSPAFNYFGCSAV